MINFSKDKKVYLYRLSSFSLLLLAWSLPTSLFGMQLGMGLLALVIIVKMSLKDFSSLSASVLDKPIMFWLATVALSLLLAPNPPTSFVTSTSFWVVVAYFGVFLLMPNPSILRRAVLGIIFLASAVALLGIFESATGKFPLVQFIHSSTPDVLRPAPGIRGWFGAVGLFQSRLTFAHVLLFPFCWSVALMMEKLTLKWRMIFGLAVVILSLGMVFSWTRAAPVVAVVVCMSLAVGGLRKGYLRRVVVVSLVGRVALAVLLSPDVEKRLKNSFSGKKDWARLAIWHSALDLGAQNPMAGIGYGNFQRDVVPFISQRTKQVRAKKFKGTIAWAHNNILTFFAEAGALGVVAFCWIFFAYFMKTVRLLNMAKNHVWIRGFLRGAMASVAAFLLVGLFHDTFFDGEVIITLWFTMGASLATERFLPRNSSENAILSKESIP